MPAPCAEFVFGCSVQKSAIVKKIVDNGSSLYILRKTSRLRNRLVRIVGSTTFERTVLCLIIANSLQLALQVSAALRHAVCARYAV